MLSILYHIFIKGNRQFFKFLHYILDDEPINTEMCGFSSIHQNIVSKMATGLYNKIVTPFNTVWTVNPASY